MALFRFTWMLLLLYCGSSHAWAQEPGSIGALVGTSNKAQASSGALGVLHQSQQQQTESSVAYILGYSAALWYVGVLAIGLGNATVLVTEGEGRGLGWVGIGVGGLGIVVGAIAFAAVGTIPLEPVVAHLLIHGTVAALGLWNVLKKPKIPRDTPTALGRKKLSRGLLFRGQF